MEVFIDSLSDVSVRSIVDESNVKGASFFNGEVGSIDISSIALVNPGVAVGSWRVRFFDELFFVAGVVGVEEVAAAGGDFIIDGVPGENPRVWKSWRGAPDLIGVKREFSTFCGSWSGWK